jgi:hypothetical protein
MVAMPWCWTNPTPSLWLARCSLSIPNNFVQERLLNIIPLERFSKSPLK